MWCLESDGLVLPKKKKKWKLTDLDPAAGQTQAQLHGKKHCGDPEARRSLADSTGGAYRLVQSAWMVFEGSTAVGRAGALQGLLQQVWLGHGKRLGPTALFLARSNLVQLQPWLFTHFASWAKGMVSFSQSPVSDRYQIRVIVSKAKAAMKRKCAPSSLKFPPENNLMKFPPKKPI